MRRNKNMQRKERPRCHSYTLEFTDMTIVIIIILANLDKVKKARAKMEITIINLEHLTPRLKHLGQLDSPIILMQKSYQT